MSVNRGVSESWRTGMMGQAHPNSINVKNALKRISFASHIDVSLNSNYSLDESTFFTSLTSFNNYKKT
jgi:hypothetical protein